MRPLRGSIRYGFDPWSRLSHLSWFDPWSRLDHLSWFNHWSRLSHLSWGKFHQTHGERREVLPKF